MLKFYSNENFLSSWDSWELHPQKDHTIYISTHPLPRLNGCKCGKMWQGHPRDTSQHSPSLWHMLMTRSRYLCLWQTGLPERSTFLNHSQLANTQGSFLRRRRRRRRKRKSPCYDILVLIACFVHSIPPPPPSPPPPPPSPPPPPPLPPPQGHILVLINKWYSNPAILCKTDYCTFRCGVVALLLQPIFTSFNLFHCWWVQRCDHSKSSYQVLTKAISKMSILTTSTFQYSSDCDNTSTWLTHQQLQRCPLVLLFCALYFHLSYNFASEVVVAILMEVEMTWLLLQQQSKPIQHTLHINLSSYLIV